MRKEVYDAAIDYIERGLSVFPVRFTMGDDGKVNKTPLVEWKCFQSRVTTKEEVDDWMMRFDDTTGIGIVTGAISNLIVIDVERDGDPSIFPPTAISTTQGNGWHYWCRHPGHHVGNAQGILPNVDIRGDGGFVVAPPSTTPIGEYAWVTDFDMAPLADYPSHLFPQATIKPSRSDAEWEAMADGASKGSRTLTLAALVGRWIYNVPETSWEMLVFPRALDYARNCEPPMHRDAARKVFDSICAREKRKRLENREVIGTPEKKPVKTGKKTKNHRASVVTEEAIAEQIVEKSLETYYAVRYFDSDQIVRQDHFVTPQGITYEPFPANNNYMASDSVAFPSAIPDDPWSQEELSEKYLKMLDERMDMSDVDKIISMYYVFLTYVFDEFYAIPYLHILGDAGSGKSTLGNLLALTAYHCHTVSSATTVSPIYRFLNDVRGTLYIEELDATNDKGDRMNDMFTILNVGYKFNGTVSRSGPATKDFMSETFRVYGPKIINGRTLLRESATESRCLRLYLQPTDRHTTEWRDNGGETKLGNLKKRVPLHFTASLHRQLLELRNHLTAWRLMNYGTFEKKIDEDVVRRTWSPRTTELTQVLMTVVQEKHREDVFTFATRMDKEMKQARGIEFAADIVEVLTKCRERWVTMAEVATRVKEACNMERVTPKWIGGILRKELHLEPKKCSQRDGHVALDLKKEEKKIMKLALAHDVEFEGYCFPEGVIEEAIASVFPEAELMDDTMDRLPSF